MHAPRTIWIPTVISIAVIWIVYGGLFAYQLRQCTDPAAGAGVGFGYVALMNSVAPACVLMTLALLAGGAFFEKRRRRKSSQTLPKNL